MPEGPGSTGELSRRLGTSDAVVVGLGSMVGAGVFTVFAPAAAAAGPAVLLSLGLAAVVAFCNATSSARLAVRYPSSGGTYVYGRERLSPFWGYLAGWGFVVGKTASAAAMALTVGLYAWPEHAHAVAVAAVVLLTAVNYVGVQRSVQLTKAVVALVLLVLAGVVAVCLTSGRAPGTAPLTGGGGAGGVLQAAGLLFFAFAGYARIATLAEEVRDPARTVRVAVPLALGLTLLVYLAVGAAVLTVLGGGLATSGAPLADAVTAAGHGPWVPVVRVAAAVAALGALLGVILGISRTTLAMARDGHLPSALAAVHPRFGVPHRAELAVGAVVAVVAAVADVRAVIGFSSFAVLVYYAVTNASAWTLRPDEGRPPRVVPVVGFAGCLALAFSVPAGSLVAGAAVLAAGALVHAVRRRSRRP
ncbi:APC family permease [Kineococcus sp. SYSU DK002]|uniref:APC family permease n=1 Tax=Kineococcus sp. SYSU DK002 TaxID=3383123 RepID=UPI003D7DF431